ncbi:MAG: hypothetical protein LT080_13035 [Thiobacillus sp.]|nr:hypothetical protein [Thiobacillus sp.]
MIPSVSLYDHDRQILQRLQRCGRQALLLYIFPGTAIVVAGAQAAGSRFDPGVVATIARKPLREALLAARGEIP